MEKLETQSGQEALASLENDWSERMKEIGHNGKLIATLVASISASACSSLSVHSVGESYEYAKYGKLESSQSYCDQMDSVLIKKAPGSDVSEVIERPDGTAVLRSVVDGSGKITNTVSITTPNGLSQSIDCNVD